MQKITYKRPRLTQYQRDIIDAEERYTITEASTKTGKTASHIVWLFEQSLVRKENEAVWWVAPVYGQAEIAFHRMKKQINDRSFFKVNESKLKLTLPTGGIIQFKSAEKPDNLYGDDVYACVFDEASRAKEAAWWALRSTLTATRGKCKMIGNSKGKKNWMYRLGQKARGGEPNYKYFKITAYDAAEAGILSYEEIEQAKRDLPEAVFKELYLAEPQEDGSNPFGAEHIGKNVSPVSLLEPVLFGVDLAKKHDWTVITGLDINGQVCCYRRIQKDWTQTIEEIKMICTHHPILIDSTGVGDAIVETLQRSLPNVEGYTFTGPSKQKLMEGLAMSIQKGDIKYPEDYVDELESFEYTYSSTGVRYSAPPGFHDDKVCSLALANYKRLNKIAGELIIL